MLYFGEVYEERTTSGGTVGVIHLFAGSQRVASIRTDGYEQYYHPDHLGSASIVTDQAGTIQEKIEYFPFGSLRERSDYSSSFPAVNYTFTDQESDDEVGLYNFKARLYDPVLGRFLSADSVIPNPGDLQSYNRYSYCQNNPLIYVDPSGHFSFGSFFKSLVTGIVAGAAFAAAIIVEAGTWGTATPLATALAGAGWAELAAAGAIAGAVGGGLGAGLQGGNILQGALMGAAIGGVTGGIAGGFAGVTARAIVGGVFAAAGAGVAYAQGGLDGLANFGAGLVGAMAGAYAVNAIADPQVSPRDQAYLNKYYKPVSQMAQAYNVDPTNVLGVGIESGFGSQGTYLTTGDAFGMTGGSTANMTYAGSPEENVQQWFDTWGEQVRGTGSNTSAFLNGLQGRNPSGELVSGWRVYNIQNPQWRAFITSGINQMRRDIPLYLQQRPMQ